MPGGKGTPTPSAGLGHSSRTTLVPGPSSAVLTHSATKAKAIGGKGRGECDAKIKEVDGFRIRKMDRARTVLSNLGSPDLGL